MVLIQARGFRIGNPFLFGHWGVHIELFNAIAAEKTSRIAYKIKYFFKINILVKTP